MCSSRLPIGFLSTILPQHYRHDMPCRGMACRVTVRKAMDDMMGACHMTVRKATDDMMGACHVTVCNATDDMMG
jgi:hypothetical protein